MIGYAAELLCDWVSKSSDIELTRAYYDYRLSDDIETRATADVLRGEIVSRFMRRSLEDERLRREQNEKEGVCNV